MGAEPVSVFFAKRAYGDSPETMLGRLWQQRGSSSTVTSNRALQHSAVWACLRLRADLISTSPVDVYREKDGRSVLISTPGVLVTPAAGVDITEWLYSSQMDLDRFGNCFGYVTRDSVGKPVQIDLIPAESMVVRCKGSRITGYRVNGETFEPSEIWHERQFTTAGCPVGLSPIAHAAMSILGYLNAQEFARDWFAGSAVPAASLKNTAKTIDQTEAREIKARFKSTVSNGDVFVHGQDWEFKMLGGNASEAQFLEAQKFSISDVCRFLGVPGDMVDAETSTGSITYANVTQRNLQLLIMNLGPAIVRRERALTKVTPKPQYVKLNTDAVVLRMDPKSQAELFEIQIKSRTIAPSEVREIKDLPPFTPEQIAEFDLLGLNKSSPTSTGEPA